MKAYIGKLVQSCFYSLHQRKTSNSLILYLRCDKDCSLQCHSLMHCLLELSPCQSSRILTWLSAVDSTHRSSSGMQNTQIWLCNTGSSQPAAQATNATNCAFANATNCAFWPWKGCMVRRYQPSPSCARLSQILTLVASCFLPLLASSSFEFPEPKLHLKRRRLHLLNREHGTICPKT